METIDVRGRAARRGVVGGLAVMGVLVLLGAAAWACVPQASLRATPGTGPVGTRITLTGSSFDPAGQPVKIWWGGAGKMLVATSPVSANRSISASFSVPDVAGGVHVVAATQLDANGQAVANSPVNTTFRVEGPAPAAAPSNLQGAPGEETVLEPVPAEAVAPEPTPASAPAASPAPAVPPRTRVAPANPASRTGAPTPRPAAPAAIAPTTAAAPAQAPDPPPAAAATPASAPEQAPAPAVDAAPATGPARQPVTVPTSSGSSDGSPVLAIALVAIGLVLALGASALVLTGRRDRKTASKAAGR